jgi:hypothetical protein
MAAGEVMVSRDWLMRLFWTGLFVGPRFAIALRTPFNPREWRGRVTRER